MLTATHAKLCGALDINRVELASDDSSESSDRTDYRHEVTALQRDGNHGVVAPETHYQPEGGTKEQGSRESFAGSRGAQP
jgi:hypothetical protein